MTHTLVEQGTRKRTVICRVCVVSKRGAGNHHIPFCPIPLAGPICVLDAQPGAGIWRSNKGRGSWGGWYPGTMSMIMRAAGWLVVSSLSSSTVQGSPSHHLGSSLPPPPLPCTG